MLKALLDQNDSAACRILDKAGVSATDAQRVVTRYIERQPRVSGSSAQVLGRNLEARANPAASPHPLRAHDARTRRRRPPQALVEAARSARDKKDERCAQPPPLLT